jgi:hypothetical protein
MSPAGSVTSPSDVFYVVQSARADGERTHSIRSDLYETRPQAESEFARLSGASPDNHYGVWKSTTYIEPAEWRHRVVRSDGTLILPRLHGVDKLIP